MGKRFTRRSLSVRHRLLVGIGSMLIPTIVLAIGAVSTFNISLGRFEQTEGVNLHESFPVADLELLLIRVSLLAASAEEVKNSAWQEEFEQLSQEVDQKLNLLKHEGTRGKSALLLPPEHQSLVTAIHRQWMEARSSGTEFFEPTPTTALQRQTRQDFIRDVEETVIIIHRLNYLMNSWQYRTNLQHARTVSRNSLVLLTIICGIALALAVLAAWWLSRVILGPLKVLEGAVSRFSEGELSHRIALATQDEFAQLAQAFNQMAARLEQSQSDLQTLATVDGLTGVYNRREFNRWLHIEMEKAQREQQPLSLMMFDIDYFKKLNDSYGHQSGDIALKCVSALLMQNVRPGDIVARYGGEEFAVILPQATIAEAVVIAERIRREVASQAIEVVDGQVIQVTASLGLATYCPSEIQTEEELLGQADSALYRAKESGRNQVQHVSRILA
jgi:two-component system, cell cycle response regulator